MATVVLARHGETLWNRERRIQGWAPVGLAPEGREQAVSLGSALASAYDVERLYSSDLTRARETARLVRRELPSAPATTFTADWRERDFGVLQGLTYEALFSQFPEYAVLDVGYAAATARPEGGERLVDTRARVLRAMDELVADLSVGADDDPTAVVITHGGPVRFVLGALLGLDVTETLTELAVENCSVTELDVADDVTLPPAPDDGAYEPVFPEVTSVVRRPDCAHLEAAAETD